MFALSNEPIDYQLTVHYNNYESHHGKGSFMIHLETALVLSNTYPLMTGLIDAYGEATINKFLSEVIKVKVA